MRILGPRARMPPNKTIGGTYTVFQNILHRNETRYYRDERSFWFPVDIYTHIPSEFAFFFFFLNIFNDDLCFRLCVG